ncbi:MAG: hypothetical protein PVH41_19555 [Anaerolineae bacterium]|jgi:hypothetical protein
MLDRQLAIGLAGALLVALACSCAPESPGDEGVLSSPAPQSTVTAAESWLALLEKRPHPYATPLPDGGATVLDGIYVKLEPKEGTPVPCRRCPDYLPEGGIWRLSLNGGVFHIFHQATRWQSLGSFSVDGERLYLFNDPTCFRLTGVYGWEKVEGGLDLTVVEDGCQVDRRARSFSGMVWESCQPPSTEAATTGHWRVPLGCEVGKN